MSRLTEDQLKALRELRVPFPPEQIGKLPKGGTTLDYVGHAALTARLLDVDPEWTWEPVALDERGLPAFDGAGGLWIRLTVAGMTRLGYGDAGGKTGSNATKEAIGDALRNAAMRFGAALDLWSKEDLTPPDPVKLAQAGLLEALRGQGMDPAEFAAWANGRLNLDVRSASADVLGDLTARVQGEGPDVYRDES